MTAWGIRVTYRSVAWSDVLHIRSVIRVADRRIELTIRVDVYKTDGWSDERHIEGPVHEIRIPSIDEARMICVVSISVVVQHQTTYSVQPSVTIADLHIPDLAYTTIPIVENRNILHLYHRTVIVILYVGAIVETGIECGIDVSITHRSCGSTIGKVKIEFTIRINRKGYPHLIKNYGVCVAIDVRIPVGFGGEHHGRETCEYQR